ncbi:MAG: metal dependent phosphohydrolase [Holophagaceae bacterium]|nr:metal dependent phosphohydrolase [Holophagaceae bacterium]
MKLGAIILAAGLSSRMGSFKPLLEVDGETLLLNEISLLLSCGVERVVVVTGNRHEDVCGCLSGLPQYGSQVAVAFNPDFQTGMFSSVLTGVKALGDSVEAFFLLPSDCPGVSRSTLLQLSASLAADSCSVAYPVFHGRRGHPPLISAKVIPDLLEWHGEGGLKQFLRSCEGCDVAVDDGNVLNDLDTPSDLMRYIGSSH